MITTAAEVACPRCARTPTIPLAREGDLQRRQCPSCSENFTAPFSGEAALEAPVGPTSPPRFAHVPIAAPDPADVRVLAAEAAGVCPKCEKPYLRLGKKYDAHVGSCKGVRYVAPGRRRGRARAPTPLPPSPAQVYDQSIAALMARRASLEAEISGIDVAIAAIEKLRGAGGAAPAPFSPGSGPAPCSP